jgi:hypothetical protein
MANSKANEKQAVSNWLENSFLKITTGPCRKKTNTVRSRMAVFSSAENSMFSFVDSHK